MKAWRITAVLPQCSSGQVWVGVTEQGFRRKGRIFRRNLCRCSRYDGAIDLLLPFPPLAYTWPWLGSIRDFPFSMWSEVCMYLSLSLLKSGGGVQRTATPKFKVGRFLVEKKLK